MGSAQLCQGVWLEMGQARQANLPTGQAAAVSEKRRV